MFKSRIIALLRFFLFIPLILLNGLDHILFDDKEITDFKLFTTELRSDAEKLAFISKFEDR
jgi:hypothetical protein